MPWGDDWRQNDYGRVVARFGLACEVVMFRECSVDDCTAASRKRGWCNTHYQRWRTTGTVSPPVRPPVTDLPGEKWAAIPGWEGRYEASTHGRIKSLSACRPTNNGGTKRVHECVLSPASNKRTGHQWVILKRDGVPHRYYVHRLVLLTFVGPPPSPSHVCCHYDDDPKNNFIENLRWDTVAANNRDRYRNARRKCSGNSRRDTPHTRDGAISSGKDQAG